MSPSHSFSISTSVNDPTTNCFKLKGQLRAPAQGINNTTKLSTEVKRKKGDTNLNNIFKIIFLTQPHFLKFGKRAISSIY